MLTRTMVAVAVMMGLMAGAGVRAAEPDLSTPKAAVKVFTSAIVAGDVNAAKVAATGNEKQIKGVDGVVMMLKAILAIKDATTAKWGEESGKKIMPTGPTEMLKTLEEAKETIDGDSATVQWKDSAQKMDLKKADGKWKVDMAKALPGEAADKVLETAKMFEKAATEIAADIKAGKYENVEAVQQALAMKMFELAKEAANKAPAKQE